MDDEFEILLVGQSLITQGLYKDVMGENPSQFNFSRELPVSTVSWFDMLHFCNKLSEMQGFQPYYYDIENSTRGETAKWDNSADGYRLLTSSEWRYIADANRFQPFRSDAVFSGGLDPNEVAWYSRNSFDRTHIVGTKKENSFGTYDQSGNLREWVWSTPPWEAERRSLHGGCFRDSEYGINLRTLPEAEGPSVRSYANGGRLARSPNP